MKQLTLFIIVIIRLYLAWVFIPAGLKKFSVWKKPEALEAISPKFVAFFQAMNESGFFRPMVGAFEIIGGILLATQVFALSGAMLLMSFTVNIFMMHFFLDNRLEEVWHKGMLLFLNVLLLVYDYKKLKSIFSYQNPFAK